MATSQEMPSISDKDSLAWIGAPLLPQQRRDWRDKIGGYWKWSEALPGGPLMLKLSPDPDSSCLLEGASKTAI